MANKDEVEIKLIEVRRTYEDSDTHAELAIYIDGDFCGDFVVTETKLESFFTGLEKGFGKRFI